MKIDKGWQTGGGGFRQIRRVWQNGAVLAILMAGLPSGAWGLNTLTVNAVAGYQSGDSAEYTITSPDSALNPVSIGYSAQTIVAGGFESFCLEYNQFVAPGGSYHYDISGAAIPGGGGAVGGSDPISIGTALLYQEFAAGTLAGYNYTPGAGREASAAALQNAFWWLEDEITLSNPSSNIFLSQLGNLTSAKLNNNGFYNVGVLNMGPAPNYPNQDLLVMTHPVPDTVKTVLLFGVSLCGLCLFQRAVAGLSLWPASVRPV